MKTKNNKKVLAWVLSICMAIALLPAMPVEYAQAAEGDLVFDFAGLVSADVQLCADTTSSASSTELSDGAKVYQDVTNITNGSAPWVLSDICTSYASKLSLQLQKTGFRLYAYKYPTHYAQLGLKLRIEEGQEGWYNVNAGTYRSGKFTGEAKLELYNGESSASDLKLSSYTDIPVSNDFSDADMGTAYFKAGEYYFLMYFKSNHTTGDNNNGYFYLKNITFEKVAIAPSATSATVEEGASTDITLALNEAGASLSDVTYSAEVAGGAEATVSGSTLTVKGVSAGDATVTVTAKVGDSTVATLDIPVTVTAPAPEAHPIFGTSYAYIREDYVDGETRYKLILIAAVDSLDYSKVGFNYTLGDATEASTEETSAYKTLTLGEASLTAADLGVADGYLFYSEIGIAAADAEKGITFNAYADNGVVSEGGSMAITSVVNKAQ